MFAPGARSATCANEGWPMRGRPERGGSMPARAGRRPALAAGAAGTVYLKLRNGEVRASGAKRHESTTEGKAGAMPPRPAERQAAPRIARFGAGLRFARTGVSPCEAPD